MQLPESLLQAVAQSRARVHPAYPWWLRPFLMRGVAAITLGRHVYLSAGLPQAKLERFLRHELAHVRQIADHGLIRFYWRYLREYVALRRSGFSSSEAYRRISFEIEASAAEETV